MHSLNIDYRHYYDQIPLPPNMQRYFVIVLGALTKALCPRGMPMGYRDACLLAQALTLAIVLFREAGEDDLGVEISIGGEAMPGMITLRWGTDAAWGAIFVLLDGVLIFTESAELRDRWVARLQRNEKLARVVRKVTHIGELGETFPRLAGSGEVVSVTASARQNERWSSAE